MIRPNVLLILGDREGVHNSQCHGNVPSILQNSKLPKRLKTKLVHVARGFLVIYMTSSLSF